MSDKLWIRYIVGTFPVGSGFSAFLSGEYDGTEDGLVEFEVVAQSDIHAKRSAINARWELELEISVKRRRTRTGGGAPARRLIPIRGQSSLAFSLAYDVTAFAGPIDGVSVLAVSVIGDVGDSSAWILSGGQWSDTGIWSDAALWEDAA